MIKTGHDLPIREIAHCYQMITDQRGMPVEFYDRILNVVGPLPDLRVLDVGCGDGTLLQKIADCWPSAELFGADIVVPSPRFGSNCIRLVRADLRVDLPFESQCMDLVLCTETLEHLVEPGRCLKEMVRVLRPGGRILVSIPNATGYFPFHYLGWRIPTRTLRRKFLPYEHPANTKQPLDTMYEFHEIVDMIRHNGFKIERLVGYRYFRYLLGLRFIGRPYGALIRWIEPFLERIGAQRFAYNLILLLVPSPPSLRESDDVQRQLTNSSHESLKTGDNKIPTLQGKNA